MRFIVALIERLHFAILRGSIWATPVDVFVSFDRRISLLIAETKVLSNSLSDIMQYNQPTY